MPLAIRRGAFRPVVFEFRVAHDVAAARVQRRDQADRPAVPRQNDQVVRLVVHDAVETVAHMDLLNHRQRLQVEHGDGVVAAVRREAVTRLRGDPGAMHARRVGNISQYFAGSAFNHHHVGASRNEHAPRGGFDGDIVRASVTLDIELLSLERLRAPDGGRGKAAREKNRKCGHKTSGHTASDAIPLFRYRPLSPAPRASCPPCRYSRLRTSPVVQSS